MSRLISVGTDGTLGVVEGEVSTDMRVTSCGRLMPNVAAWSDRRRTERNGMIRALSCLESAYGEMTASPSNGMAFLKYGGVDAVDDGEFIDSVWDRLSYAADLFRTASHASDSYAKFLEGVDVSRYHRSSVYDPGLTPIEIVTAAALRDDMSVEHLREMLSDAEDAENNASVICEFSDEDGSPYMEVLEGLFPVTTMAGIILRYADVRIR